MKKKVTAVLLGVLLIGTLGAAVVSATTSDDEKANGNFGQMHTLCGKYMNSNDLDSNELKSMHKSCGSYMNSEKLNPNRNSGIMYTGSSSNEDGFSCH